MLQELGTSLAADLVYRTLVARGGMTVDALAARLSRGCDEIAAAIEELVSLRLVAQQGDEYEPEPPVQALDALIVREQDRIRERQRQLDEFAAESTALIRQLRRRETDAGGIVEVVGDKRAALRRCGQSIRAATREIWSSEGAVQPQRSLRGPFDDDDIAMNRALLARGVRLREIYDPSVLEEPGRLEVLRRLSAEGLEGRTLAKVKRIVVIDRELAVLPIDPDDATTLGSMFIGPSGALEAVIDLFETLWERALPIMGGSAPDAADARLVAMLAAGLKDESIARELGVSQPTVTRRVTRLLTSLDASSRFQAGAQAVRRGLV